MRHLSTLPLLEVLRPPAGWRTDRAILSAYSAEPEVLVAILLALSGRDDDAGNGSKVALARSLTDLRDRVTFVLQRGRIAAPRKARRVLALLDRFVREVEWDEGDAAGTPGRSWHAKVALVRMVADHDAEAVQWRFWLGSRNFTRDTSWDIGLSLETSQLGGTSTQVIAELGQIASRLSIHAVDAPSWKRLVPELTHAQWDVPRGLSIRRVLLMLPEDVGRGLPLPPPNVRRLLAVAPFLDGKTVSRLASWTDAPRTLLSTIPQLRRLANQASEPLEGFELLRLPAAPEPATTTAEEDAVSSDASLDARGLHAKLLWAEHSGGATLWLGSPNLTSRAWYRNAEAFVEIRVQLRGGARAAQSLHEGLAALQELATPIRTEELRDIQAEDLEEEVLEAARRQVAARLFGCQRRRPDGTTIIDTGDRSPHPDVRRVSLEAGRLGGPMVPWPRNTMSLALPYAPGDADTELLVLCVSLLDQTLCWTQRVRFDPRLPLTRDTSVLREYLGARGILLWIRDVLDDASDTYGCGPWDSETDLRRAAPRPQGSTDFELPTVERVLRAWLRDPERLQAVDHILNAVDASAPAPEEDGKDREHLQAFSHSWKTLRAGLMGASSYVR